MGAFIAFLESTMGRLIRVVVGMLLIVFGVAFIPGVAGGVVAIIGLFPLFAGLSGVCLIGLPFGYTLTGQRRVGPWGL